jgi:signal transduction histidine kinase
LNKFIIKIRSIFDSQKEFIRDVSHELKTPLMQIDSSIELLENKLEDRENIKRLDSIKESVENINNLISKL